MLILTRRPGERIKVGDDVVVTVVSIKGNQVSIGIDAPREVPVDREEIAERKMNDEIRDLILSPISGTGKITR